jgi:PAS domain-containing protein
MPGGGAVRTFSDVTESRKAEAKLRASEERYRLAARATNDAVYDWDLVSNHLAGMKQWRASSVTQLPTSTMRSPGGKIVSTRTTESDFSPASMRVLKAPPQPGAGSIASGTRMANAEVCEHG